jgi:hypothetical protein
MDWSLELSERQLSTFTPSKAAIPFPAISGRSLVHSAPSWSFVRKAFVVTAELRKLRDAGLRGFPQLPQAALKAFIKVLANELGGRVPVILAK